MFGAICGDIIGSSYEVIGTHDYNFELFNRNSKYTDDTVLTIATCDAILSNSSKTKGFIDSIKRSKQYAYFYKHYYRRYPYAGYGQMFQEWAKEPSLKMQSSYGNGGAMRVIPIAYAYDTLEEVLKQVKLSCHYTHNNKEAITGAQAVASALFLALHNNSKEEIKKYIEKKFKYNLSLKLCDIKENYVFNSRTSYSVPPSIIAFLESTSYIDAIRKVISLGGDADTMACISGGIAEAYYKDIPDFIYQKCLRILDISLKQKAKEFLLKFHYKIN